MIRHLALTAALAAGMLAGCADAPSSGLVVSTEYNAEHYDTILYCGLYSTVNNVMVCTMWLPMQVYVAAAWSLKLVNGKHKGWRDVPQSAYNVCRMGDDYPACASH